MILIKLVLICSLLGKVMQSKAPEVIERSDLRLLTGFMPSYVALSMCHRYLKMYTQWPCNFELCIFVKGVPLRLALGAKDMQKQTIEVARRDKPGNKEFVPWDGLTQHVVGKLDEIQVHYCSHMFAKAWILLSIFPR